MLSVWRIQFRAPTRQQSVQIYDRQPGLNFPMVDSSLIERISAILLSTALCLLRGIVYRRVSREEFHRSGRDISIENALRVISSCRSWKIFKRCNIAGNVHARHDKGLVLELVNRR